MVYICILTANSVTAYAANMTVLLKDGVKRTVSSCYPDAIECDLRVLAVAPKEMTLAGLSDCCIFWGGNSFISPAPYTPSQKSRPG